MSPVDTPVLAAQGQQPQSVLTTASQQTADDYTSEQGRQSTFPVAFSGDLSWSSDRLSGLTQPAQQMVNTPEFDAAQYRGQKPMQFTRFIASNGITTSTRQQSPASVPRFPNHEARVASRHGPHIFREGLGTQSGGRVAGGHNSYANSLSVEPSPSSSILSPWNHSPPSTLPTSPEEPSNFHFADQR